MQHSLSLAAPFQTKDNLLDLHDTSKVCGVRLRAGQLGINSLLER